MAEPHRPAGLPGRPVPPVRPLGTGPVVFPEPPVLRNAPPGAARACANCASPVTFRTAPPLCWGCGRSLCADCYWRHGLSHSMHTCATCAARGVAGPMATRSGGRATNVRRPAESPAPSV